jgi:integrase
MGSGFLCLVLTKHINPCKGVKQLKENSKRARFLPAEECVSLLDACSKVGEDSRSDACPGTTLRSAVELALQTGMRRGELLRLAWEHVNLRQGFIEILDRKNGGYDTIPLNKRAAEILTAIPRRIGSDYVFTGKIPGKPIWDLKRQSEKAVKMATLEGATLVASSTLP